ncbi:hypothetical protein Ciccas_011688, partial [Cichlidogyrus casuarinus]
SVSLEMFRTLTASQSVVVYGLFDKARSSDEATVPKPLEKLNIAHSSASHQRIGPNNNGQHPRPLKISLSRSIEAMNC